jgi:predicted nucleotidyltransferase
MTDKLPRHSDSIEIRYNREQWELLSQYRQKAQIIIEILEQKHIQSIVHGSIARGDVDCESDIDIFIPNPPSSFLIETALEQRKISIQSRKLIQATPTYAMKAYIELGEETTISFPLMQMRRVEKEFYTFSGEANLERLKTNVRVAGVDKRLMFIEPTETGHSERSIIGSEELVARKLGVAVETVFDRVRALMKRDAVGRTGVFVKKELSSEETFELALKRIADENPAVRRRIKLFH